MTTAQILAVYGTHPACLTGAMDHQLEQANAARHELRHDEAAEHTAHAAAISRAISFVRSRVIIEVCVGCHRGVETVVSAEEGGFCLVCAAGLVAHFAVTPGNAFVEAEVRS